MGGAGPAEPLQAFGASGTDGVCFVRRGLPSVKCLTRMVRVMCLSVDDSSDQCLFTRKGDPLQGTGSQFCVQLPSTLAKPRSPVGAPGNRLSLSWSRLFPQLFSQGAFGYVLPIISFLLAWIETWFLDFKVLPQEAEEENSKCLPGQAPETGRGPS